MDPIPAWVWRLWDVWDLRMLVLLSLALQIILTIFGNRRRYISSLWLNVVVWSAYLTADWVATVALGKLSDTQSDDHDTHNALRAIWAPMLLLHLGGPDTITAYSLEDNQLWMRHLLGLVVQVIMAVYVILMSWKNSWFSFLSLPALVAGIIKYGERTWVLKSVCNDKSGDIVPFSNHEVHPRDIGVDDEDVRNLVLAKKFIKGFKAFMEHYNLSLIRDGYSLDISEMNLSWDAIEVGIRLMYDILYTKAAMTYSKLGCIFRCVSFACAMSVLVGISWLIFREGKWHDYSSKVDIAITVSLLAGALSLEIYAITMLISSDWAMLWLIKHKRAKWVIQLRQRFTWLFKKKKTWSTTMGQFDLLGFCIKEAEVERRLSRRIVGRLFGTDSKDKFNRYMHKTSMSVPLYLRDMILDYFSLSPIIPVFMRMEKYDKFWKRFFGPSLDKILEGHIITEICYHLDTEWDPSIPPNTEPTTTSDHDHDHDLISSSSTYPWRLNKEACRVMSHYMVYLCFTCPSLLIPSKTPDGLERIKFKLKVLIGDARDVTSSCRKLMSEQPSEFGDAVHYLKEKPRVERWELLKSMWLRTLIYEAGKGRANEHLQQLRQGGGLLTSLWFFLPQSRNITFFINRIELAEERLVELRAKDANAKAMAELEVADERLNASAYELIELEEAEDRLVKLRAYDARRIAEERLAELRAKDARRRWLDEAELRVKAELE